MCCCFRSKGAGNGGSKGCLCWFIISMLASIIALTFALVIESILGGPVPTAKWDTGSKILCVANILAIVLAVICIIIIVRVIRNRIIGISALICMIIIFMMSVAAGVCFAHYPGVDEMSPYVRVYYNEKRVEPPALKFMQDKTRAFPNNISCCGGADFRDYAASTKRRAPGSVGFRNEFIFDVPDSCCTGFKEGCGKGLHWDIHLKYLKLANTLIEIVTHGDEFLKRLKDLVTDELAQYTTWDRILHLNREHHDHEDFEEAIELLHEYNMKSHEIKIAVLGCGKFLDLVRDHGHQLVDVLEELKLVHPLFNVFIALIVLKIMIVAITLGVYLWYYSRWNWNYPLPEETSLKPQNIDPMDLYGDGSSPAAAAMDAATMDQNAESTTQNENSYNYPVAVTQPTRRRNPSAGTVAVIKKDPKGQNSNPFD